jgi:hypothetical protein
LEVIGRQIASYPRNNDNTRQILTHANEDVFPEKPNAYGHSRQERSHESTEIFGLVLVTGTWSNCGVCPSCLRTGRGRAEPARLAAVGAHHAIEWILDAYRHEPHKPVINLEAMYDGHGENGWQAVDARSLAWRSWLAGAKGYTYGAGDTPPKCPKGSGGIWRWVTEPEKPDFWKKAIECL